MKMRRINWNRHYNENAEDYWNRNYLDYSDRLDNIIKKSTDR